MKNLVKMFPDATRKKRNKNVEIDYPDDPEFTERCISRGTVVIASCMLAAVMIVVSIVIVYFKWMA